MTVGQGDVGQLGLGDEMTERKRPTIVTNLQGSDVVQIISGGMHTVALSSNGKVSLYAAALNLKKWGLEFQDSCL